MKKINSSLQLVSTYNMIKGMRWMSEILISSYRLKEVTNSYVLYCCLTSKNYCSYIFRQPDILLRRGLKQNVAFLNGQIIYFEKSKLNFANM